MSIIKEIVKFPKGSQYDRVDPRTRYFTISNDEETVTVFVIADSSFDEWNYLQQVNGLVNSEEEETLTKELFEYLDKTLPVLDPIKKLDNFNPNKLPKMTNRGEVFDFLVKVLEELKYSSRFSVNFAVKYTERYYQKWI